MLILRGIYASGIVVDQNHPKAEDYSSVYMNDVFRDFVSALLTDPVEPNDTFIGALWLNEDGKPAYDGK